MKMMQRNKLMFLQHSEMESICCFTLILPNAQDQQQMFYGAWAIEQFEECCAKRGKRRNGWNTGRCEI
ncbi:uncharacterized protein MONOS_18225 [Monocercomonoides exilis]|uniref:uncharacterized protein n=1 Tax=Monocercomonoides exilis TaxID=2049356 RepID=UPI00355AC718|nr:hypothetical protein MONOS_18225 [Monocercomonoides exilis]